MKQRPQISVIIPVYNVGEYLVPCLESVRNQSYANFEVLLIDDGSNDGSEKICDEYASKDPRFKVTHKKNAGVSAARNTGIDLAQGAYISFVDSDDRIKCDYFEVLYRNLVKHQTDAAFCNYAMIDEKGGSIPVSSPRFQKSEAIFDRETLLASATKWGIVWAGLMSAELVCKHRFSSLRYGEDSLFMFDLLCSGMTAHVDPYEGYLYLQRKDSATATNKIPLYLKAKDHLTVRAHRYIHLPEVSETVKTEFLLQYARQLYQLVSFAADTKNREHKEDCKTVTKEHLMRILPESKKLPLSLRVKIKTYAYVPRLYTAVLGVYQQLRK